MSSDPYTILIDTCALARFSYYLDACDTVNLPVGSEIDAIKNAHTEKCKEIIDLKNCAPEGLALYKHLQDVKNNNNNAIVYCSLLSKIELHDVFLDIIFDAELLQTGIPYRVRRKKPLRWQVLDHYRDQVDEKFQKLEAVFSDIGIILCYPEEEKPDISKSIYEFTNVITKNIFLESFDAYLYALSLYNMVDELYTNDNEFRVIIRQAQTHSLWKDQINKIKEGIVKISYEHKECCYDEENRRIDIKRFPLPKALP